MTLPFDTAGASGIVLTAVSDTATIAAAKAVRVREARKVFQNRSETVKRHPVRIRGHESIRVSICARRRGSVCGSDRGCPAGLKYQLFHSVKPQFAISKMP